MRFLLTSTLLLISLAALSQTNEKPKVDFDDDLLKHHYFYRSQNDSFVVYSDGLIEEMKAANKFRENYQRIYADRGSYFDKTGEPGKAFDQFNLMYDLSLQYQDTMAFSFANGSIAWLNSKYDREELAIQRLQVNLNLWTSIGDYEQMGDACHNIQRAYFNLEDYENSLEYARRSYSYLQIKGDSSKLMQASYWLARAYTDLVFYNISGDTSLLDSARFLNEQSQAYYTLHRNSHLLDRNYLVAGRINLVQGEYKEALANCKTAEKHAGKTTIYDDIYAEICDCMAQAYGEMGQYQDGLFWSERYRTISDSLNNLGYALELEQKELTGDLEQQQLENQLLAEMDREKKKAEIEHDLWMKTIYLIIGIVLFAGFIVVMLYIRRNARQKESSNERIIHYNREITDSINYAKRIQKAILPSKRLIADHLQEHFILYKPKDIVAGDFYWFETVGDIKLLAAADCTGHGVPGAMVSVVCHNALNRAVREFGFTCPGKILDKTKELVVESFQNRGIEDRAIRDGMDISLCAFHPANGSPNGELKVEFAGANNPVWIYRKGETELEVIKGTRQPVGETDGTIPFETTAVQVKEGDQVFLLTDGFADQFGGPDGKKFRYKTLRELLVSKSELSTLDQKRALEDALDDWMGELEQVDDVCLIGVRI